ncbi:hypothetical protein Tco_0539396 [Tanacetum coccineum]
MRFIPKHESVQKYDAIIPDTLTNQAMKDGLASHKDSLWILLLESDSKNQRLVEHNENFPSIEGMGQQLHSSHVSGSRFLEVKCMMKKGNSKKIEKNEGQTEVFQAPYHFERIVFDWKLLRIEVTQESIGWREKELNEEEENEEEEREPEVLRLKEVKIVLCARALAEEPSAGSTGGSKREELDRRKSLSEVTIHDIERLTRTQHKGRVYASGFTEDSNLLMRLLQHLCSEFKPMDKTWNNPKGQQYPHDLRKPLPLIPNSRGRRVIPFDHFVNNDLAYAKSSGDLKAELMQLE